MKFSFLQPVLFCAIQIGLFSKQMLLSTLHYPIVLNQL